MSAYSDCYFILNLRHSYREGDNILKSLLFFDSQKHFWKL